MDRHLLLAFAFVTVAADPGAAAEAPRLYVTDRGWDVVSVVDTATNAELATIPVGPGIRGRGIAIVPGGRLAVITNGPNDTVSLADLRTGSVTNVVLDDCPLGGCNPRDVAVTPDGHFALVIAKRGDQTTSVIVLDIERRRVAGEVALDTRGFIGYPEGITTSPGGDRAYVVAPATFHVIDVSRGTVLASFEGSYFDVAVSRDGSSAYVAGAPDISILDTETNLLTATISLGEPTSHIAASPDGATIFALTRNDLVVIDAVSSTIRDRVHLGELADFVDMAVTPDGERVLVVDLTSQSILVVDPVRSSIIGRILLAHRPERLALSSDSRAYLTNLQAAAAPGALTVVDLDTAAVSYRYPAAAPASIGATPDGSRLLVANSASDEVLVIDAATHEVLGAVQMEGPVDLAVPGDGALAYVSTARFDGTSWSGGVSIIDVPAARLVAAIPLAGAAGRLAASSDGRRLYVVMLRADRASDIHVIDTATRAVTATIPIDLVLSDLVVSPDDRFVYAASFLFFLNDITGAVAVINSETNGVEEILSTGGIIGIAVAPDGRSLQASTRFYSGGPELAVIDAGARAIRDRFPVDVAGPVAISPDGTLTYLAGRRPFGLNVIDTSTGQVLARVPLGVAPSAAIGAPAPQALDVNSATTTGDGCSIGLTPLGGASLLLILLPVPLLRTRILLARSGNVQLDLRPPRSQGSNKPV